MRGEGYAVKKKILVADDHPLAREGMRAMLASEADVELVGEAEDGEGAVELCRKLRPDLVLMDVRMPKMDGLAATREIKGEFSKTSVLMVTSHESVEYLLDAVKAGAAGYILKDATKEQLMDAVRSCLAGDSPLNQQLAMRLLRRLAKDHAEGGAAAAHAEGGTSREELTLPEGASEDSGQEKEPPAALLTPRELEVLGHLAAGKTNREIAKEVHLSLSTVKDHVQRIILKLEVSDRTQAAVRALETGLLSGRGRY